MKKVRSEKIVIDLPRENTEPWIEIITQIVEKDDSANIIAEYPRHSVIHRKAQDVAYELTTIYDPITNEMITISGYGVQMALTRFITRWMANDLHGEITYNQKLGYEEVILPY
jgi:hypothetical protein